MEENELIEKNGTDAQDVQENPDSEETVEVTETAETTETSDTNEATEISASAEENEISEPDETAEASVPSGVKTESEPAERDDAEGNFTPKASKKTTAVLFAIIGVLVVLIVVFVVLIMGKLKKEKEQEAANKPLPTQSVSAVTAAPTGAEEGAEEAEATATPYVRKDYHVTVTLGEYKGLEVDFPSIEVTAEDINNELADFLDEHSEMQEITDRPSQNGDTLNIDYTGYMDGEEFDGGTDTDVEFVLGSGQFFEAFEDGLVGREVGEYTLDLTFPEDYYEDIAGKPVTFVVTINSISEKWTPALTDELIEANTEYKTVNEYKAYIEGYLTEEYTEEAEEQVDGMIVEKAVENASFSGDIDEEIEDLTVQYMSYYDSMAQNYYGIDGATLFSYFYGMDEEQYKNYLKDESAYTIKLQYMLDEVAKVEELSYTQEEYDAEFEEIFISYYGFADAEEALATYTQEEIDETIAHSLLREKAQNLITGSAKVNR
ncbi:MAG: trigger factor [Lachnospiraceae bacterium]|nr:trigger factor [Lachnospiraceae bacterium]